jgi:hypothetical protein
MERMRRIRAGISAFEAAERLSSLGIDVYQGWGVFDSPSSLVVNGQRLTFRKVRLRFRLGFGFESFVLCWYPYMYDVVRVACR